MIEKGFEISKNIRQSAIEILRKLVSFDTTSRNSNLELIDWVEEYVSKFGAKCRRIYNDEGTKANLIASFGPNIEGGIILSGHSDVVPIDDQDWDSNPWELLEKDNKLYGRGTSDMKAFSACFLALLPHIEISKLKAPIYFALSYDEEIGCLGAPSMVNILANEYKKPLCAIIGEPTNMKAVSGHKAITTFKVEITGLEAHSSRIDMGVSAIMEAIPIMQFLKELGEKYRPENSIYEPKGTTITIGLIEGGTAVNILAHHCTFVFDIRSEPEFNLDELIEKIAAKIDEIDKSIKMRAPNGGAKLIPRSKTPGLGFVVNSAAENIVRQITGDNEIIGVAYAAEAGLFQKANIPSIICGPGSILQAHQPNEFIEIIEIDKCLNFLNVLGSCLVN